MTEYRKSTESKREKKSNYNLLQLHIVSPDTMFCSLNAYNFLINDDFLKL